jgi:hypothetical protein
MAEDAIKLEYAEAIRPNQIFGQYRAMRLELL